MSALAEQFRAEAEKRLGEVRKNRETVEAKMEKIQSEELQPLLTEEQEITAELARLAGQSVPSAQSGTSNGTRGRGRPPAGTPSRKDQVLELVREATPRGGISISEMQQRLEMSNPNYLYRVTGKDLSSQLRKLDTGKFVLA